jgi:hypothetical protein
VIFVRYFSEKKFGQRQKISPIRRNFAQSGHSGNELVFSKSAPGLPDGLFVFKPKIPILVKFGPWNRKWCYIL